MLIVYFLFSQAQQSQFKAIKPSWQLSADLRQLQFHLRDSALPVPQGVRWGWQLLWSLSFLCSRFNNLNTLWRSQTQISKINLERCCGEGRPWECKSLPRLGCVYKTNPRNLHKSFQVELPALEQQDKNTSGHSAAGPPPSTEERPTKLTRVRHTRLLRLPIHSVIFRILQSPCKEQ